MQTFLLVCSYHLTFSISKDLIRGDQVPPIPLILSIITCPANSIFHFLNLCLREVFFFLSRIGLLMRRKQETGQTLVTAAQSVTFLSALCVKYKNHQTFTGCRNADFRQSRAKPPPKNISTRKVTFMGANTEMHWEEDNFILFFFLKVPYSIPVERLHMTY